MNKPTAINSLRPNAKWVVKNDILEWLDAEQTQPTEAEITAEVARLQAEYDNNEYQRQRAKAYPSMADQLDTIYHEGIDAWKAQIAAVKQEYPKP
jgi:phosphoglycolate phosphatase-like HAD superfamily hydrolase